MGLTYRIHPEAQLLVIRGDGTISQQERLETLRAWMRDPAYPTCTAALCDFTTARSTPGLSELHELIQVMRDEGSDRGPTKLAIVTPRPVAFGIARVFQELIRLGGFALEVRAFRHRAGAWAWLRPDMNRSQLASLLFE
jgi:hypothetical protein